MAHSEQAAPGNRRLRRFVLSLASLLLAALIWLPCVHWFFVPGAGEWRTETGNPPIAAELVRSQLALWTSQELKDQTLEPMRMSNPEWDFMGRTFLVLSLANMTLRDPDLKSEYLPVMDTIIDDTCRQIDETNIHHFMMSYSQSGEFIQEPARSVFIDGEIALMMGARRLVEEKEAYRNPMREHVDTIVRRIESSQAMICESYPNECWMFCNTLALAAVRMQDALEDTDHAPFFAKWMDHARKQYVDKDSGLLISSCTYAGRHLDGPEGSSVWMAAHCLQIVDEAFATDQYNRARAALEKRLCGFAWAREWPAGQNGFPDIDSGPIIPLLEVSAGSSGMAFLGAASFGDIYYYNGLATTLNFAGFPARDKTGMRFCASNQVGDAVVLYSTVMGPLWELIKAKNKRGALS